METQDGLRQLDRSWDYWTIAAAMIISFLGTFTSTQLMIQARSAARFSSVLTWITITSLTFGFCAVWSLHFVSMLACTLDLPIGLDLGLTIFTGVLAVMFTFIAIGVDLLRKSYNINIAHLKDRRVHSRSVIHNEISQEAETRSLLGQNSINDGLGEEQIDSDMLPQAIQRDFPEGQQNIGQINRAVSAQATGSFPQPIDFVEELEDEERARGTQLSSSTTLDAATKSSSQQDLRLEAGYDIEGMAYQRYTSTKNVFLATYEGILAGMSWKAVFMGLVWSLSITSMHYGGLAAMKIPGGFLTLDPVLVIVSAVISWIVCVVGYIYMIHIEAFLSQQILFSVVAAFGIASMHFTGMRATTFWSIEQPASVKGYPVELPIAVCSIAIFTCMLANGLMAHSATLSRNKLAEIVWTRRKLWRTIAEKENAEAAADARSNFIALASHEIRTPLHHLQGYSDLLSRTDLSEESRQLLSSIQSATKTLTLITNNVLDWSKLESHRDALCRPTALDMRTVFESILLLLPNKDEEADVEIMVVIAPNVPRSLMLDEIYIHRILMNLLSNSLKFTTSGYVMLTLEIENMNLVFTVRDTGSGIPPSFLPQLFEPFSQAQTKGSQRGTGLGLNIVRQLLDKMNGTIEIDTQNAEQGFSNDETGTSFIITIPVPSSDLHGPILPPPVANSIIAIIHPRDPRTLKGLLLAWAVFGYEVIVVESVHELFADLPKLRIKYVWVDSRFLQRHPECVEQLLIHDEWTVLVPFENQAQLKEVPALLLAGHLVPVQKPLIWHTFDNRVAIAGAASRTTSTFNLSQVAKVASPEIQPHSLTNESNIFKNINILLVEDNPINQKLSKKMLTSLGYTVLLANDGDEAISQTYKYDTTIDMILMDQSMPIKDGVTATREIRKLEATGKLSIRHPIIAITAVVDSKSRAKFKDAGADDFLAKPLSLATLEQTLSMFLLSPHPVREIIQKNIQERDER